MSTYPSALDSDATIQRVDDNLSEIGTQVINQIRDALFAVEKSLGINPFGSASDVTTRLNVFSNPDGSVKASALTAIGLVTLPITDIQVANNAAIKEIKLALDFSTSDLHTEIAANTALLTSLNTFAGITASNLTAHITGADVLFDNSPAKHILSHILLNQHPTDPRDVSFTWNGLRDKNGNLRSATQAMAAMDQINTDLISHENSTSNAHLASAIIVDTDNFTQIPLIAVDVQQALNYIDQAEELNMGLHRATQHANGVPRYARSNALDGYQPTIVLTTPAHAYLVHTPAISPVDDISIGDDLIKFNPVNPTSGFNFDAAFSQVRIGDVVNMNYNNGISASFVIDSLRYVPGVEWIVRINGTNLAEADGYASIVKARFDSDTWGVLSVAGANPTPAGSFSNILSSVIVGHPRGATALGLGFFPGELDGTHYNLYLEFYPNGNPSTKVISLPAIDVTGNLGATPGAYTLDSIVQATNDNLREIGFNYRLIAFSYQGQFGIMVADPINNASFAVISGSNSSGTLTTGIYTKNVIGGSTVDDFDALGLGSGAANVASPAFQSSFIDALAAQLPTKVITPFKSRFYYADGQRHDDFLPTYKANDDGYWDGYISARNPIGIFTVETTYTIGLNLEAAGLKAGKTIVVEPAIDYSAPLYSDVDYGRFIIKTVSFPTVCGDGEGSTEITVINGISTTGNGFGFSSSPVLPVRIYFSQDSVSFDIEEVIDQTPTTNEYRRLHEIVIDRNGHTFAHERARMPRQAEDSSPGFLSTAKLHLLDVSPKLRGYQDSSPLVFNKYVRFYITNYDTTSGEFDGYLGQRPSAAPGILRPGPLTKGRKSIPSRFYDESGVDYIEVEYVEGTTNSMILSTASSRFVDIELFPSLQNETEFLTLATCEVNWTPDSNSDVVRFVKNARQFGSVSEKELTDSALNFISSGDKFLHQNGVIQGFQFQSTNSSNNQESYFNGGIAVVNGKIVLANNNSVALPIAYTGSLPQTITWAVCLNEFGQLIPIIVTVNPTQSFVTAGVGSYYLPSLTFSQLVLTRKDLLPLYLATATVSAGPIISAITFADVRKYVQSEGANHPLVLSADTEIGNFETFDALKNYLINYGGSNNNVKIKGNFNFSTEIDLSGFTSRVILEGVGTTIVTTAARGMILGSNITLRNINFIYNPSITLSSGFVNSGNGCLYAPSGTNLSNITIEQCSFSCIKNSLYRPPFVNLETATDQVITNLIIRENHFSDQTSINQAAIAIINLNSGGSSNPAVVDHCRITDNICDSSQSIYLTSIGIGSFPSGTYPLPGLTSIDSIISGNLCGGIGFVLSNSPTTNDIDGYIQKPNLIVEKNQAEFIGGLDGGTGKIANLNLAYGTGETLIANNKANYIHVYCGSDTSEVKGKMQVVNNSLRAFGIDYVNATYGIGTNNRNAAIRVLDGTNGVQISSDCLITGNVTDFHTDGVTGYDFGVIAEQNATISNNILRGLNDLASGILFRFGTSNPNIYSFIVTGNFIGRPAATTLTAFIDFTKLAGTTTRGIIDNNRFSNPTIDGTDVLSIGTYPSDWVIGKNSNLVSSILVNVVQGRSIVVNSGSDTTDPVFVLSKGQSGSSTLQASMSAPYRMFSIYLDTTSTISFAWIIPLYGFVPRDAAVDSISVQYNLGPLGAVPDTTKKIYLIVGDATNQDILNYTIVPGDLGNVVNKTLGRGGAALAHDYYNRPENQTYVMVLANIKDSTSGSLFSFQNLTINFRF